MLSEEVIDGFIAKYLKDGQAIGIGSGKEGETFLKRIALKKEEEKLQVKVVPTSAQMASLLAQLHIESISLEEKELDLAIEFVDLATKDYDFVKRNSASFIRDKMIAQSAETLVIVTNKKNYASMLYGVVPFEICSFGWKHTLLQLDSLGAAKIRMKENTQYKTESGNYVVDVLTDQIPFPEEFEMHSKNIPGVIETGLFVGYADRIVLYDGKIEVKSRIEFE